MLSTINPGDRVTFPLPPQGIQDRVYSVLTVLHDFIPKDTVCVLTHPSGHHFAALGSELSPLTIGENHYGNTKTALL